jgi:hypothetical protein
VLLAEALLLTEESVPFVSLLTLFTFFKGFSFGDSSFSILRGS